MRQWSMGGRGRTQTLGPATGTSAPGTSVTASATVNTKGAWTDIGGVTSFAFEALEVVLIPDSTASPLDITVDIGISDGVNRYIIAEDLLCKGRGQDENGIGYPLWLHVPSGAQLSARCQADTASAVVTVAIIGQSAGPGGMPGYSRLRALYAPVTSGGVIVDTGATANTKVRTQIIASTGSRSVGVLIYTGFAGDITRAANEDFLFDLEQGAAAAEEVIIANIPMGAGTAIDMPYPALHGPFNIEIPSGIRVSVNAQSNTVTAGNRTFDVGLWGYEP